MVEFAFEQKINHLKIGKYYDINFDTLYTEYPFYRCAAANFFINVK